MKKDTKLLAAAAIMKAGSNMTLSRARKLLLAELLIFGRRRGWSMFKMLVCAAVIVTLFSGKAEILEDLVLQEETVC
jgi:hypothetical protein